MRRRRRRHRCYLHRRRRRRRTFYCRAISVLIQSKTLPGRCSPALFLAMPFTQRTEVCH
jgi:hypothetical protein